MLIRKALIVSLMFSGLMSFGQEWKPENPVQSSFHDGRGYFGYSVALDQGTLLVGAPFEKYDTLPGHEYNTAGAAYFFEKQDTIWQEVMRFVPQDLQITEDLGTAVDISGDYAVIGAPYKMVFGVNGEDLHSFGVVYVFHREEGTWHLKQELIADSTKNMVGGSFGAALDLNGDQLIVGDPGLDYQTGAAYIFQLQDTLWVKEQRIPSYASTSHFGFSVCIKENRFAIGAPNAEVFGEYQPLPQAGAVYVFKKENEWVLDQKIIPSDPVASDHFGSAVAFNQNILVVGAPDKETRHEYQGQMLTYNAVGIAYSFHQTDTGWVEGPKIIAQDDAPLDHFGSAIQSDGALMLISAPGKSYFSELQNKFVSSAGAIYLFQQTDGLISQVKKITAPMPWEKGKFGYSIALCGDTLVGGQISEITVTNDMPSNTYYGSVYVFHKTETLPTSLHTDIGNQYSVYPNPAKNTCVIESNNRVLVEIYNGLGHLMKRVNVCSDAQVDISSFEAGVYFVVFRDTNPVVKKLVVN